MFRLSLHHTVYNMVSFPTFNLSAGRWGKKEEIDFRKNAARGDEFFCLEGCMFSVINLEIFPIHGRIYRFERKLFLTPL